MLLMHSRVLNKWAAGCPVFYTRIFGKDNAYRVLDKVRVNNANYMEWRKVTESNRGSGLCGSIVPIHFEW